MAIELPNSAFATVAPLFAAVPQDQTFIRAAMRDPNTRLLVDDPVDPSVALLWPAVGNVAFLAGRRPPRNGALADVVQLLLSFGAGNGSWLRLAMPFPEWSTALSSALGHAFAPRERRSYTFADQNGLERCASIPLAGYRIRPMDEPLARDVAADADPEIAHHWPDFRGFVERGVGFCAVESSTGRAVSAAWSVHDPVDLVEIGAGTSEAHRGRGLSPATAGRLVAHCHARGLDPRWSTDFDNLASRRVAAKVGFGNVIEHDWPLYTPFNAHRRSIDVPDETTRDYHGRYTANGTTITIAHDGRALRFFDQLGQTLTLAAESETHFFLREVSIQLTFTRGSDGRVDGFTRHQGGKAYRMERLPDDP
ncbi:MAG: GNAT family N-acetyltransferase [Tepidisphaeraceae bacterium]